MAGEEEIIEEVESILPKEEGGIAIPSTENKGSEEEETVLSGTESTGEAVIEEIEEDICMYQRMS